MKRLLPLYAVAAFAFLHLPLLVLAVFSVNSSRFTIWQGFSLRWYEAAIEDGQLAEAAWNSYSARFSNYSPSCQWESENKANIGFNVKGVSLKGSLEVSNSEIALDLDVPFLLRPFKGQALKVIEDEIRQWIGKAKAGQV